jgi:hypothetical protein
VTSIYSLWFLYSVVLLDGTRLWGIWLLFFVLYNYYITSFHPRVILPISSITGMLKSARDRAMYIESRVLNCLLTMAVALSER